MQLGPPPVPLAESQLKIMKLLKLMTLAMLMGLIVTQPEASTPHIFAGWSFLLLFSSDIFLPGSFPLSAASHAFRAGQPDLLKLSCFAQHCNAQVLGIALIFFWTRLPLFSYIATCLEAPQVFQRKKHLPIWKPGLAGPGPFENRLFGPRCGALLPRWPFWPKRRWKTYAGSEGEEAISQINKNHRPGWPPH